MASEPAMPAQIFHQHTLPPSLTHHLQPPQQDSPPVDTPSDVSNPEIEAMTTQEALRMYAPQQKIRDKIVVDHKKGLSPEDIATKHGVAASTVHVVIKRHLELESLVLSTSTRRRRRKKLAAEEAARKESQDSGPARCSEADFVKLKNQGACVACTVKFQKIALGRLDKTGANSKRSRTHHGCRSCKVHLCRKSYCWDIFHQHAQP